MFPKITRKARSRLKAYLQKPCNVSVVVHVIRSVDIFMHARQNSGLQGNTKARSAAVHYKQLLAVGPESFHAGGTEKRYGVTETYKALTQKDIFRTSSVVVRNASK